MPLQSREKARQQRSSPHIVHSFHFSNLIGDPFAISSLSIALIAWIIAFSGSIAAVADDLMFPKFTWWGLVYQLLIMCIMVVFYCFDLVEYYRVFLTGAIAVAFLYNTNSANNLVYYDGSSRAAASAGVIILSMVNLVWIFYYGSDNASPVNRWIDSFSLRGIRLSVLETSTALAAHTPNSVYAKSSPMDLDDEKNHIHSQDLEQNPNSVLRSQNYVSSTALNGFENTELPPPPAVHYNDSHNTNTYVTETSNTNTETTMGDTLGLYSDVGDELSSFPYTAKALYDYNASESDAYEISFEQGEILRVGDIEGRWWKAKKATGETGIIPSNYVQLIDDFPAQ